MKRLTRLLLPARPNLCHAALLVGCLLALRLVAYAMVTGGFTALPRNLCQWDCVWYMHLASVGYDSSPLSTSALNYSMADWAFFPTFSGVVALLALTTGLSDTLCGMSVANIAFVLFTLLSARFLRTVRPGINEGALIIFLFAFPFGFYFSLPYTESLYALLAVAVLFALQSQRLMIAAALSSLLLVTRVTGILLLPVLAWQSITPVIGTLRSGQKQAALAAFSNASFALAIAPAGLTLFMAYLYLHVGDALAFKHIQAGWGRTSTDPIAALIKAFFVFDFKDAVILHVPSQWFYATSGFAGLIVAARLVWIGRYPEAWFLAATVILAASQGVISLQRFVLANPVMLIFLFDWIWQCRARRILPALLLAFAAIQLYLVHCWGLNYSGLV